MYLSNAVEFKQGLSFCGAENCLQSASRQGIRAPCPTPSVFGSIHAHFHTYTGIVVLP